MNATQQIPSLTPVDFNPFEEGHLIEKMVTINQSQQEIFLSCLMGGSEANLAYNESITIQLEGDFQTNNFQKAFAQVLARHEALRSVISTDGTRLVIYEKVDFIPRIIDSSSLSATDQLIEHESLLKREMCTAFDLFYGPLFRVIIQKNNAVNHSVTFIFHHIICDGWSIGIILEDLSKIYNAYAKGTLTLLPQPYQISKFAEEQAKYLKSEAFKQVERFWLNQYQEEVPVINFPTDYPRGDNRSYQSNRIDHLLEKDIVKQLRLAGAKTGNSLVNTMLSLFELFIYKKTRQTDVIIGLPAAAQAVTGNFDLVGHCVNILPLKTQINPEMLVNEYLCKRKKEFLDCFDHQLYSFGQLISKLNLKRESGRIPLIPIVFNIDMGMDSDVHFDGLYHQIISNARVSETFEIFVNATDHQDGLILEWNYNSKLFSAESINRYILEFKQLLERFIQKPNETIIDAVSINEQPAIVSGKVLANNQSIVQLLNNAAIKYADADAATFNSQRISYSVLAKQSDQLAADLMAAGMGPGKVVGLAIDRSLNLLIGLIAILKTGAAYLPIDPHLPKNRINYMLNDAAARILIHDRENFEGIDKVDQININEAIKFPITSDQNIGFPAIKPDSLAYIIYTSGSTGTPKGVKVTHKNLANLLLSVANMPGIVKEDRFLAITTISFDIAAVEIFLPLISGAQVVIADQATIKDGRMINQIIEEAGISILQATPSTLSMLMDAGFGYHPNLKVIAGGEALTLSLAQQILASGAKLWNMYGPTETTIYSIGKQIFAQDELIAIGKPVNNTTVEILDDNGNPVSVGTVGEICIGGDGVSEGYINNALQTSSQFIGKTHFAGLPLYRTGDLGKIHPNGEIQCFGRIDNQVKIRGFRIEPTEIEAALLAIAGVDKAIVIQRDDVTKDTCLIAYLVTETNKEINTEASSSTPNGSMIKVELGKTLPNYMVPDFVVFINSFPLTVSGKIDRKALPKPVMASATAEHQNKKLSTTENLLAEIWKDLLGINEVCVDNNFFELGGHSLLAVKMMVAIEKKFAMRLPISVLLTHPTISELSRKIDHGHSEHLSGVVIPIRTEGKKPPVFLIHGSGLNVVLFQSIIPNLDNDQPIYGIQALGLHHAEEIPQTIEEIASRYIKEIIEVQPDGPYNVVGYSLGGFIAFEIARQLKAIGKEIKLLGVIDTDTGRNILPENSKADIGYFLKRQVKKVPFIFKSFLKAPSETLKYQLNMTKSRFLSLVDKEIDGSDQTSTDYEKAIARRYHDAYNKYLLEETDVKVSLFRVTERLYYLDDLNYLGWDRFAKQGVTVFEIPGDHKTFLSAPNHISFAQILQTALND